VGSMGFRGLRPYIEL